MTTHLSPELLLQLSKRIEGAMGLHFPPDRLHDLDRKIRLAARELAFLDVEAFAHWLLSSPLASDQVHMLAGYLTIGETYFYREPRAWKILQNEILPPLIVSRTGNNQRLRFWSAACSTGEEPYTIAMILTQAALPNRQDWQCMILATDINPNALRRAQSGIYGSWSFRSTPPEARACYFTPAPKGQSTIRPELKKMVTFVEANLVSADPIPNSGLMDVIFCCNVLFYFTPERVKRVLERFYDTLVDGGWLIVSPVETAYFSELPFVPVVIDGTTVYRKDLLRPYGAVSWPTVPQSVPPSTPEYVPSLLFSSPVSPSPQPLPTSEETSHPVNDLGPLFTSATNSSPLSEAPELTLTPYEQAQAFYAQGQYEHVVTTLLPLCSSEDKAIRPKTIESQTLLLLARAYANQGRLSDAQVWCEKAITNDRFNSSLHYLLATILLEQERIPDATRALQKAVYVNPGFVLAHFALGNLLQQQQRHIAAKRYLTSALVILQGTPRDEILPESEGLTAGRLMELINSMLRR
jgi:chemotaxis protein methyltransferase CheR